LSVSTAPASPSGGDYIFYHGEAQGDFAAGDGIYKYDLANTRWVHQDLGFVEQGIVALPFSTTTEYAVNDRCYKDGKLWKCVDEHEGIWDASDFTEVTLDDVIPKPLTDEQMAAIKAEFKPIRMGNITPMKIYSPIEHQVDVWQEYRTVNGVEKLMEKPLYTKTIISTMPNAVNREKNVSIGASIDYAMIISCTLHESNGTDIPLLTTNDDFTGAAKVFVRSNSYSDTPNVLRFFTKVSGWLNLPTITVLNYTKTTDEWEEVVE
jgi:hypothetical protein